MALLSQNSIQIHAQNEHIPKCALVATSFAYGFLDNDDFSEFFKIYESARFVMNRKYEITDVCEE